MPFRLFGGGPFQMLFGLLLMQGLSLTMWRAFLNQTIPTLNPLRFSFNVGNDNQNNPNNQNNQNNQPQQQQTFQQQTMQLQQQFERFLLQQQQQLQPQLQQQQLQLQPQQQQQQLSSSLTPSIVVFPEMKKPNSNRRIFILEQQNVLSENNFIEFINNLSSLSNQNNQKSQK